MVIWGAWYGLFCRALVFRLPKSVRPAGKTAFGAGLTAILDE